MLHQRRVLTQRTRSLSGERSPCYLFSESEQVPAVRLLRHGSGCSRRDLSARSFRQGLRFTRQTEGDAAGLRFPQHLQGQRRHVGSVPSAAQGLGGGHSEGTEVMRACLTSPCAEPRLALLDPAGDRERCALRPQIDGHSSERPADRFSNGRLPSADVPWVFS
jgi:hypothetical protein